jgi:hypothetical protein
MTIAAFEPSDVRESIGAAPAVIALMHSGSLSKAVSIAAELGLADLLARGSMDVNDLAHVTHTYAPALRRLLRALATVGLCVESADGRFALTPAGALLRSDAPHSLRSWIRWWGEYQWPSWSNLLHSVKTGESARNLASGTDGFGHLECDPQAAAMFNDAMVEMTRLVAGEVVRTYDFAGIGRIVDVGGGFGALAAAVLQAYPNMEGTIFDRPHAVEGAKRFLVNAGVAERCEVLVGDFFESVPAGGDAYLLKSIIHDWDDERSLAILRNCRQAISEDGKVLLIERVMPTRLNPTPLHRAVVCSDLAMLVGPGGRERSVAELEGLLAGADFSLTRVLGTAVEYSILEATPGRRCDETPPA